MGLAEICVFYTVYLCNWNVLWLESGGRFFIMRSERLAVSTPEG